MDLDEIYNKYDLSIRTYNICKDNDLLDIISIHNHYTKYDTFKNLRNCGVKSDYELKYLCKSFNSNIDYPVTTSSNSNEKHNYRNNRKLKFKTKTNN
jgi:hypothetical protein